MSEDNMHYLEHIIGPEDAGVPVRTILRDRLKLSRSKVASVKFDPRGILLNGEHVTVSATVKTGDLVQVLLTDSVNREVKVPIYPIMPDIRYEDQDVLVVYKPAGLVCHPCKGHIYDNLAGMIRYYYEQKDCSDGIHLVGRLDKDTSGLVLIARNSVAAERLEAGDTFHKVYLAVIDDIPSFTEKDIDLPMAEERTEGGVLRMVTPGPEDRSLPAHTHVKVMRLFKDKALCEITLGTGRMHQIRFHMASIGLPLLGDSVYGRGPVKGMQRAALHAGRLKFVHPFTGESIEITCSLPEDFQHVCGL